MSKVLVVGESWFTYSVHQKGFDSFTTAEYVEGGGEFIAALRRAGHDVSYIPSHLIHTSFPTSIESLRAAADVVVVSDVGANTFQLAPDTFSRSLATVDKSELLRQFVAAGGGLLMVGGYLTFTGIDAKGRWGRCPLAAALPVTLLDCDDRVELPSGAEPRCVAPTHPVAADLEETWPALLGLNEVVAKPDSAVVATCAGHPLLVTGSYESGRSAAFTSDIAPHWAPPAFVAWPGYQQLFDRLVRFLAGEL